MFVFRKKRFALILILLCVSFSSYFLANKSTENRSYDITQVSSLPVTEKVVIIDAGHGGEDGRCRKRFWSF